MSRRGTDRLLTAVTISTLGFLAAILAGEPEAAVLVTPWAVLLVLGFSRSRSGSTDISVDVTEDRLLVGEEVEITTTIKGDSGSVLVSCNPSEAFWAARVDDEELGSARLRDVLVADRAAIRVSLVATQWGVHDVGHVEVTVTEPYGLFRWSGVADRPRNIRVSPNPASVQNLISPWLVRSVAGLHTSRASGRGVEYADIRPFASGDSLREINWRASARSEDIWVSQRHPDRATDVVLLLDSFVESGHDVRTVFGLAIEGAVTLAESHLAVADRVGLVELGGNLHWIRPGAGRHQLRRLSDTLLSTGLHSHVADRNLVLLMSRALPPRSFVVALTPLLDDRFIDALFILGGNGHDVAAIECDASPPSGDDMADGSRRVARRLWDAERQVTRDRLAERGIAVARWHRGDHLDLPLLELANRRLRILRGRHR